MMNLQRTYIHLKRAWYAGAVLKDRDFVDEVGIQIADGNVTLGEFAITYHDLPNTTKLAPRLGAFDDGWRALVVLCSDLLEELADHDGESIPPEDLCALLGRLGFADATPVVQP